MPLSNLEVPEIKKILNDISAFCFCHYGKVNISGLQPMYDYESLKAEISKIGILGRHYIKSGIKEPDPIECIDTVMEKCLKVNFLLEDEMGRIYRTLDNICSFLEGLYSSGIDRELMAGFESYGILNELVRHLSTYISASGYIRPDATPLLNQIIAEKEKSKSEIHKRLDKYLSRWQKLLQDDYYTVRDGRYVLPVKAGSKKDIKGVVRDTSNSGDTIFIEPQEIGELNNRLFLLNKREEKEKEAVLSVLTAKIRKEAVLIHEITDKIGYSDSIMARTKYMLANNLRFPDISEGGGIFLKKAVHPVYSGKKNIVSNDYVMKPGKRLLLITGPNGGGKTVSLKTISSIVILTQMAVPVPVGEGSETRIYKRFFFDMGDTQDMESGMSSFTAKMHLWKEILEYADEKSLVVVDELGNFTNPYEGAAISCAFIDNLIRKGATLIAGTHLDQVKEYVTTIDSAETASMMWDKENMMPLYLIIYGVVSGSFAVDMAERIGFPKKFILECENLLKSDYIYLEGIRKKYEHALRQAEENGRLLEVKIGELEKTVEEKRNSLLKLKTQGKAIIEEYSSSANRLLMEYRTKMEALPAERNLFKKTAEELVRDIKEINRNITQKLGQGNKKTPAIGDKVYLSGLNKEGKVIDFDGERALILAGGIKVSVMVSEISEEETSPDNNCDGQSANRRGFNNFHGTDLMNAVIDLRGKRIDESIPIIDKTIDDAILLGLNEIKIIHGAGKGGLRPAVHEFLKSHSMIKSFKTGGYLARGGSYYTLAEIK